MAEQAQQTGEFCFLGEYEYTVDAQRRIAIPKAWWNTAPNGNHFYLLPGRGQSLQLVPGPAFQELLQKLRRVSFADGQAAVALATIGSMAQEIRCDRQGRMSLSQKLMDHAGIVDKALMLGAVTTIQIWEPGRWQRQRMNSEAGLDALQAIQERPDDFSEALHRAVKTAHTGE